MSRTPARRPVKAVVLAAGRGSRMRRPDPGAALSPEQARMAAAGLKALLPVAGRPLLDPLLDRLAAAGIERVCVVRGRGHEELRRHCRGRAGRVPALETVLQSRPAGTADALLAARRFAGDDPFLMLNSDNLYPAGDLARLAELPGPGLVAFDARVLARDPHSNVDAQRLAAFAAVELDEEGHLLGIVEKPPPERFLAPGEHLVSCNCWRFSPRIFDACDAIAASPRGELELPTAVLHAISELGERFVAVRSAGPLLDLSSRADVAPVAARLATAPWPDRPGGSRPTTLESWRKAGDDTPSRGRFRELASALAADGVDPGRPATAERVPGRIELLGKHTDYAGGRSLTCATRHGLAMVCVPRADAAVRILDAARDERVEFAAGADLEPAAGHWVLYPMTVARRLARDLGRPLRGFDAAFASDLPEAAGLASSSVLVVAFFRAFAAANDLASDPVLPRAAPGEEALAAYLGAVERGESFGSLGGDRGVGTLGGDGDHTAILCARRGAAVRHRYLPTRLEDVVAVPPGYGFAVATSGVAAHKTGAARDDYNRASRMAADLAGLWRSATGGEEPHLGAIAARGPAAVDRLRALVRRAEHARFPAADLARRLEHFLEESERLVPRAADALAERELERFGALVEESQAMASTHLGNQVPETRWLARAARELGAAAASSFGAGFGGSVWALVADAGGEGFLAAWAERYAERFPERAGAARFFLTPAAAAARPVTGAGSRRQR